MGGFAFSDVEDVANCLSDEFSCSLYHGNSIATRTNGRAGSRCYAFSPTNEDLTVQPPSGFRQLEGDGMCRDIDNDIGDWSSGWVFGISLEECADYCLDINNIGRSWRCVGFSFSDLMKIGPNV